MQGERRVEECQPCQSVHASVLLSELKEDWNHEVTRVCQLLGTTLKNLVISSNHCLLVKSPLIKFFL